MNSARTLADRFRTQRTDRIRVDGVEVLSMTELSITEEDSVEIVIEDFRDDVEQSLHIRAKKADLQITDHVAAFDEPYEFDDSIISTSITLVADQARRIEFGLAPDEPELEDDDDSDDDDSGDDDDDGGKSTAAPAPARPVTLQLWNSWLIGDAEHAWTGNSGVVVEELDVPEGADARLRLWCSDGLGDPQFDDLVVVITVGPKP